MEEKTNPSDWINNIPQGSEKQTLMRTRSEQLLKTTPTTVADNTYTGQTLKKISGRRSPGHSGSGSSKSSSNVHIRKSRSAQLNLDNTKSIEHRHHHHSCHTENVSSGAALSRASSASLGFSFSFTGFTVPPEDIANSKPFSNDDTSEDLEVGIQNNTKKMIHAESTVPIYLKFKEVTYKVITKGVTSTKEKLILNEITGSVNPSEVLALLGPSGSGKTTLLSLLGGRLNPIPECSVTYNDKPYSKFLKSRIGFVTQDDVLFPHLTVKETLTYAALLRLPKKLTTAEKQKRALDVIYGLGLERCKDTMIGGSFVRGISGGERKRVCIGNEIIINPSLLFLDEPTSGLDSTTALRIVDILQDIAQAGKTVITTIHQPSSRLFHKFDKLILLGKGSLLYFGKASEAMGYFTSIGCSPLIFMNPAEFLLDLANGNTSGMSMPWELEDKVHVPSSAVVHEFLVKSYETRVAVEEKKKLTIPTPVDEEVKLKIYTCKREWGARWWDQFSILVFRGFKERRHDYFSCLRITQVLTTAVILGLLWWQSDAHDTPKDLQDQAGLLFFISVFWGFFPVFTAIFTFPQERAMIKKERAADMYKLSAYFVARTTSDLPLDLILPLLFLLVVYFMAGLRNNVASFFLTMVVVFLCIVAAQGLGLAIGATVMDLKRGTTLASVTVMTFMLSGGYFVKEVPVFISWLRYLSFNYHTYKLLLKVQYGHITHSVNGICIDSGWKEVSSLLAMVIGYRLFAYLSLRRMKI